MTRHHLTIIDDQESTDSQICIILELPMILNKGDYFEFTESMFKAWNVFRQPRNPEVNKAYIEDIGRQMAFGVHFKAVEELVRGKYAYVINDVLSRIDKEGMYVKAYIRIVDKIS